MTKLRTLLTTTAFLTVSTLANAEPAVVASIKPVHSLVAAVMQGVGSPGLIVEGAGSPHTYALKPSQARQLEKADLVFWIGPELESFLERPIQNIAADATSIKLLDSEGVALLNFRETGVSEDHDDHDDHGHKDHDDHGHDDHDDHAHKDHDDHGHDDHDDHAHKDHDDHDHDDHGHHHAHDGFDPHIWLDPHNAEHMIRGILKALVTVDPANKAQYEANARSTMDRIEAMEQFVSQNLADVRERRFVTFHDAYQYFEERFGLQTAGSVTISPEVSPGAERVKDVRKRIMDLGAACVFSEPQFEPKLVSAIMEGSSAKTGVLDPLGADIPNGPDLYFTLIRNMAASFQTCLSADG